MSEYRNFIEDFPRRCRDILDLIEGPAERKGREVTLMLMVASAAFVMPYERLRVHEDGPHPSSDRSRFPRAAERFQVLLKRDFVASELWSPPDGSWFTGHLASVQRDPSEWPELQSPDLLGPGIRAGTVLSTIRNALAHAGVYTLGNPIKMLTFVCDLDENRRTTSRRYRFVQVPPSGFRLLLERWFDFTDSLHVPQSELSGWLKAA
jgi:hypothetical protein